jgi:Asp-tRNA(Asn)/Glu-tRNA(Gln) amidotransferase B subunit
MFQGGNISQEDFVTIVKSAQTTRQLLGDTPEADQQILSDLMTNLQTAAQLEPQRREQEAQAQADRENQLLEQVALAALFKPQMQSMNKGAEALRDTIAAAQPNLSSSFKPFANLLGESTVQSAKSQSAAMQAAILQMPQMQTLIQQIKEANTLQDAANYQAAKEASQSGTGGSLTDLLNQQQQGQLVPSGG